MFVNNFESSKSGIQFATSELIKEGAARNLCPLEQYARINALRQACDAALKQLQDAAVTEALAEYPKALSKEFVHNGLKFQFKRNMTYTFEDVPVWVAKKKSVARAEDVLKARKTELKSLETNLLAKHKDLVPTEVKLSVSFCAE